MLWLISGIAHGDEADRALPSAPGVYDVESKLDGGRTARFTLSLPEPRSGVEPPLVLVMHYAGTPTRFYGRPLLEELVEPAFRPLHAVYVAPESINGQWHTEENEAFVMRLIDTLIKTYDVDSARIIVTGYSMGAIGAWHYVTHYPETFSAAVPVSGFPNGGIACTVPVFTFHTASDELFELTRLESLVAELQASGCPVRLTRVDANGHYDLDGFRDALGAVPSWLGDIWGNAGDNTGTRE